VEEGFDMSKYCGWMWRGVRVGMASDGVVSVIDQGE